MTLAFSRRHFMTILLSVFFIFTDFFAPYSADYRDTASASQPPIKIHLWHQHHFIGPFVYSDDGSPIKIQLFVRHQPYKILAVFPSDFHFFGSAIPGKMIHLWGTDPFGRDLFSRILLGARVSLLIAISGAWLCVHMAILIGSSVAVFGGVYDVVIQFFTEIFKGIPRILILLLACGSLSITLDTGVRVMALMGIFSFLGWFQMAKIIRTRVFFLVQEEFVVCAKMLGASKLHLLKVHILPHLAAYKSLFFLQTIPAMLMSETTVSFFGVGIREPQSSWGLLLSDINNLAQIKMTPWLLLPTFFLIISNILFFCMAKKSENQPAFMGTYSA
ncbi:MAG: ABC transporter permease [Spirochaetia bacterium]